MRKARLLKYIRSKWDPIWAMPQAKLTFVVVGTILGTGTYFYPIVKHLFFSKPKLSEEQQRIFDKENYYPIKYRKQRELEAQERRKAAIESVSSLEKATNS